METMTIEQVAKELERLRQAIESVQEKLNRMTERYARPIFYTEHSHIIRVEGVQGGEPIVRGKGVTVKTISALVKQGIGPDQLVVDYGGHLNLAEIYDALSYYYDHPGEIDQYLAEDQAVGAQFFAPDHPYINALSPHTEPVIRNTKIPVREIVDHARAGDSIHELLARYPSLDRAKIFDALSYYYDHAEQFEIAQDETEEQTWQPIPQVST